MKIECASKVGMIFRPQQMHKDIAHVSDLVDNSEAHCSRGWQGLRIVLHHALQSRAGLEVCFAGVLVFGVHKLCNDALCLL